MSEEKELKEELKRMINKGEEALEAAAILLKEDFPDKASSQAYYAVFHLMQAALLTKGLSYSKHSGVVLGFSQYFIKKGPFPKEFAKEIRDLRKDRKVGNYGYVIRINKEEAREDIETAKIIANEIKKY